MTEALTEPSASQRNDEGTAPFILDRSVADAPAPLGSEAAAPSEDEHDGVVHLVSRREDPSGRPREPSDVPDEVPARPEDATEPRLDRAGRRAARLLAWALGVDAVVALTLAAVSLGRLARGGAGVPDLVLGAVALTLALPCILGAQSAARIGRRGTTPASDAHRFAKSIGRLRWLFALKATVLFTTLGLGCFAFSMIASLLALL